MNFLCGCPFPEIKERTKVISETENRTERYLDGHFSRDAEGMVICSLHLARRQGWRSLPKREIQVTEEGGALNYNYDDHRFSGCTPAEVERYLLFGEIPKSLGVRA